MLILFNWNVTFHCMGRGLHTAEVTSHKMGRLTVKSCTLLTKRTNCNLYLNAIKPCRFLPALHRNLLSESSGQILLTDHQMSTWLYSVTIQRMTTYTRFIFRFCIKPLYYTDMLKWWPLLLNIHKITILLKPNMFWS